MFYTKVLSSPEEISEVKRLLYLIYIKELGWQFSVNNPSGLIILHEGRHKYLHDKFDSVSTWFGVYHHNTLVGCIRSIRRIDGAFELEQYHALPEFLNHDSDVVETNRLAILPEYRGTNAIYLLSAFAIEYEYNRGVRYSFTTAPLPGIGFFYIRKLGYQRVKLPPFKYHPSDENTVTLMYLDGTKPKYIQNLIKRMKRVGATIE